MSSDYRPRGGSSSSGSGSGGPRRRRGGRGRSGGGGHSGEHRSHSHTNGTSSHTHAPKKKVGPFAAFINWITGKKSGSPAKSSSSRPNIVTTGGRPDGFRSENKERTPRAERNDRAERAERPERTERPRREERVQADPVPQEIVSTKLYVGNLAYEAGESDLFDLFSKVGAVKNVEIAMDRHSNRSKGFGFVEMEALETAKEAAEKLNRTDFMGRQIVVSGAKVDKRPASPREEAADPSSTNSSEESSI